MNNSFSLSELQKTAHFNSNLIMRQYRLNEMAKFMEVKSINPKLKQSEIARELKMSSSTLQRCRKE